jgi:sugar phosphate isomerase/epimerase
MKLRMGVMQGRLSPRPYPQLQAFPQNTWENEFESARKLGLSSIEWVFEKAGFEQNPIWSAQGRRRIKQRIAQSGVYVLSVCANYFLDDRIYRYPENERKEKIGVMRELIKRTSDIGAHIILLPVLEEAELRCGEDKKQLLDFLYQCENTLKSCSVGIGIESELPADAYRRLIEETDNAQIRAYYDAGNGAAKGYDMKNDVTILYDVLAGIHIKDRMKNGPSVFLGQGDANIRGGVEVLAKNKYEGLFIFETYFEDKPFDTLKENIMYIAEIISKLGTEF